MTDVVIDVRVIPRARKTEFSGWHGQGTADPGSRDTPLVVRLAAPPVNGAANDALLDFLADKLQVPRRSVRIVLGERGRWKRVAIAGVTRDEIRARIARCVPTS